MTTIRAKPSGENSNRVICRISPGGFWNRWKTTPSKKNPPPLNAKSGRGGGHVLGPKISIFPKSSNMSQNGFLGSFFAQIFVFRHWKIRNRHFSGENLRFSALCFFWKFRFFCTFLKGFSPPKSKKNRFFENHPKFPKLPPSGYIPPWFTFFRSKKP